MVKSNWNYRRNKPLNQEPIVCLPISVEADEQWSYVGNKQNQRWLWVVFGHYTHEVIGYCFGPRTDATLMRLCRLLEPFDVVRWFTDGLSAYQRWIDEEKHKVGKRNTQKIERFFLTLRTRIKRLTRRTICFSRSELRHNTVIGLFINRYCFGRKV